VEHEWSNYESRFNPYEEWKVVNNVYAYLVRPNTYSAQRVNGKVKN
jgi:hypothetical protein